MFIWREFKAAPRGTNVLLALMFMFFVVGLTLIVIANPEVAGRFKAS